MTKARLIRQIIPIEEWLKDEFYLGPEVPYIRPYVRDFIVEYANNPRKRKFLCTGAARTGKSYGARILLQRILYEMSCWENFPCLFGLSPSTLPKIFWMSYTFNKAESTGLKGLIKMIDKVPYWQLPDIKRKPLESELVFPFCEVRTGSNISHIIGEDMLGCVLDEANVRKVAQGTEVQETQRLFQEMRQRSVMTFSKNGIWGGFSGIISSSTTASSFVAQELEKAKREGDTVIMEASVYEANPEQYSKETFPVFIGDGNIPPFIADNPDSTITTRIAEERGMTLDTFLNDARERKLIEPVPVSIRSFYEEDIAYALANMSGKVQQGGGTWLRPKLISSIWNTDNKPFTNDLYDIGIYDSLDWEEILDESYVMSLYHGENVYVHVDFGQVHDHTGFSALYYDRENHKISSLLTMEMSVNSNIHGNLADQTKVWELILLLRNWGANIKLVTGDTWAKSYLIPQARSAGIGGEYYSVDTDEMVAYLTMERYMKTSLYSVPYYKRLEEELQELVRDNSTGHIDHMRNPNPSLPTHFKDLVDAFAGASFHIYSREGISYEDLMIQQGREKVQERIPDDGFFSTISHESEDYDIDEVERFQNELYGFDHTYIPLE